MAEAPVPDRGERRVADDAGSWRASVFSPRVLGTLLLVLPLAVYATVGVYRYHEFQKAAERRLQVLQRVATEHALKVLDTNEVLLARVADAIAGATDAAIADKRDALQGFLKGIARDKPQIHSIWVLGADGRPLASDRTIPAGSTQTAADRSYFQWHRDQRGGLYISGPLTGKYTGVPFFDMSVARTTAAGAFTGVISISLSPDYFVRFHEALLADEPGLAVTMLRADGVILTRWPPLKDAPPRLAASSPVMSRISAGDTEGRTVGTSSVDGKKRLLTFARVGDYPVYVGTGMDFDAVHRAWLREMAVFAAFGLPPSLALYFVARLAWRRTRDALRSAELARSEAENRRLAESALLQSQKLEALGHLTGGVAHDFNNALMVLSSNLYLVKRELKEAFGPRLQAMERALASASQLTRQLLAFTRRQPLVPVLTRLQDQLPKLSPLLAPVLGSHVDYVLDIAPDTRPIVVDPAELELAILNLAINSRDAMPTSGRFSIHVRNEPDPPAPIRGAAVLLEVADNGSGIDAATLPKVFDPFFTTKPVGIGTGLGLSQVSALCQRTGGSVTLDSRVDAGTTVRLYFPASTETQPRAEALEPALQPIGRSVLMVEDNEEVAKALLGVLQALGCRVDWLPHAEAARQWLGRAKSLPDVLLTDVVMPGTADGFDLARHVRATYPSVRIVVMTGHAEHLDSIAARGFEIIPKPCSPEILAAAVAGPAARP